MPHQAQIVSDTHYFGIPFILMSETSKAIEIYLNLLNAAFQFFPVSQASTHALCCHSSNPLLGGDCILNHCAQATSEGELNTVAKICNNRICKRSTADPGGSSK